jgi:hypothetical protein
MTHARDRSLDTLIDLDGQVLVLRNGDFWTKFVVKRVPVSKERPHGLHYSLTLHDEHGQRVLGFDNAHSIQEGSGPGAKSRREHDHRHHRQTVRRYEYANAATLIADFWEAVDAFLETVKGESKP